jgi:hypothetical protein
VLVLSASISESSLTRRLPRSSTIAIRPWRLRASRSSFQTTRVSPRLDYLERALELGALGRSASNFVIGEKFMTASTPERLTLLFGALISGGDARVTVFHDLNMEHGT